MTALQQRRLYLASASLRRVKILTRLKIPFKTISNRLDDETLPDRFKSLRRCRYSVCQLAKKKAIASANSYQGLVLGFDTVVILQGLVFGKPSDLNEAKHMLKQLSGQTHFVVSACAVLDTLSNKIRTGSEVAAVTFKRLTRGQIDDYCSQFEVLDKAGAYGIQDIGDSFVQDITGAFDTVVGMPTRCLLRLLQNYVII